MTIEELHFKLMELKIHPDDYYLHGGYGSANDNGKPALIIKNGKYTLEYEVYYKESGAITSTQTFIIENEACEYLLNILSKGSRNT